MKSTVQPVPNEGDENTGEEADSKLRKRAIIVMLGTLGVISGVAVIATSSALSAKHNPDTQNARQGELLKSTKLQSDIDECLSDPCLHGGTCESTRVGYICHCTTLYEGMLCEIETDECQSGPCLNGGTCEDMLGGYVCHCIVPYGGRLCEIENTCLPNPCMNGGSCVFNVADETHACSCVRGFTGRACEINIDDCLTDDVCFGGQCVDGVNGFHCNCSGANGTTLTNIARNKWAIQSSTHQDNYAGRAVDDVINPDSSGGLSCAITGNQTGEAGWWKVDLGQVYCVSRVTISTPQDCCGKIYEFPSREMLLNILDFA